MRISPKIKIRAMHFDDWLGRVANSTLGTLALLMFFAILGAVAVVALQHALA